MFLSPDKAIVYYCQECYLGKNSRLLLAANNSIKVILYEDNADMREGLSTFLAFTKGFELAGSFINCADSENHVQALQPDVILMDIEMPQVNGLEGIRKIRTVSN